MTFVTVGDERSQLESLTRLLLSTFPGSVIYQQTDLHNIAKDIQETKIDAIFFQTNEMNGAELRRILQRWKPELPRCFLVEQEGYPYFAAEGGCLLPNSPYYRGKIEICSV